MPAQKLKDFLDRNQVKYYTIAHSIAFTSQEIAATVHISGHEMAKTVMIIVDGEMAMAVLPASTKVNFKVLNQVVGSRNIELAREQEFKYLFPDCEVGAMPPFGNLWGMDVYVAEKLKHCTDIIFNAGSHTELIKMSYKDYEKLVEPRVLSYAYHERW